MPGLAWKNEGRPLGAHLLISVLIHGLGIILLGVLITPQVNIPLRPEPIMVGLVLKPATKTATPIAAKQLPPPVIPQSRKVVAKVPPKPKVPPPIKPRTLRTRPKPQPEPPRKRPPVEPEVRVAEPHSLQSTAVSTNATPQPQPSQLKRPSGPAITTAPEKPSPVPQVKVPANPRNSPAYQAYLGAVRQQIDRAKRYPLMARRGGQQGIALVAFDIDRKGKLCRCEILRSSGFKQLDRAALKAVRAAAPFAALPEGFDEILALQLPIRFELRR